MRTCEEIAIAYEQSLDATVSKWTKLAIKTHFIHCKRCKQYAAKSARLQAYLKKRLLNPTLDPLQPDEKSQLKAQIRSKLRD